MINKDNVVAFIKALGDFESGFESEYSSIIDFSIKCTAEMLLNSEYENDERAEFLAAAKALNVIYSTGSAQGSVTSFTAGDVSITEKSSSLDFARNILKEAMEAAGSIINDSSFAFIGV